MRHAIGECNYRFLDALAGEFRGRGKESHVRHIIGEYNCRLLDAMAGEFTGRGMCGVLSGNAIVDCQTYWQEGSEVAERTAMCGILLGHATPDC